MQEMKKDNALMSGKGEGGKWITVNGSHIFIEDGQSVDEAMEKHFSKSGGNLNTNTKLANKSVKINPDTGWEQGQLTGDSARFNKFLRLAEDGAGTQTLIDELENIGLNQKGISAVWNADSIYGSDARQKERELMSIFNNPEYRAEKKKEFNSKQELIDFVKHQTNIELKDDKSERLNNQQDVLYARLPGKSDNNAVLSLLDKYGIRHEEHLNNGYWIWLKNSN